MTKLSDFLASMFAKRAATEYKPKFCRARRCTQPYGHDGHHTGRDRLVAVRFPQNYNGRPRSELRKRDRMMGAARYSEFSHYPGPRLSPRTTPVPGAAVRMAAYRAHRNGPPVKP